jgi:hypothetical protein
MKIDYILENSETGFVSKFATYISNKIDPNNQYRTHIKVTDFKNFVVVEGETTCKVIANLTEIKESFFKENKDYLEWNKIKNFNIIDIINYYDGVGKYGIHHFVFYDSSRPIYHPKVIDFAQSSYQFSGFLDSISYNNRLIINSNKNNPINDDYFIQNQNLSVSSSFPYGHSKSLGITELFYCEYVAYHLFKILNTDEIHIKIDLITEREDNEEVVLNINCDSMYDNKVIESLVLDVFDFNFNKFEKEYLSNYDISLELSEPFGKKPWLVRDKINDMIII